MATIRDLSAIDSKSQQFCDRMFIDSFNLKEVILPKLGKDNNVKAIQMTIHGRNFKAVAQPLIVFVGKQQLRFLRIAPDENSVEGVLFKQPDEGDPIVMQLGDQDAARHGQTVSLKMIQRI